MPKVVRGEYRVKRGDTLYSIATRHGWNYKDLARASGIRPPYAVKVGQVVRFDGRKSTYVASSRSSSSRARKPPPPPPSVTLRGWQWPMKGPVIRRFSSSDKLNKGIRIAGTLGQPVQASLAGKVVFAVNNMRGYGNLVIIQHGTSYTSTYAHNSRLLVKEGQMVSKGQKIAEAGSSDADRVQLYFEIRQNGRPLDPLSLLPPSWRGADHCGCGRPTLAPRLASRRRGIEQRLRTGTALQHAAVFGADEAFVDQVVEEGQQRVVETVHFEQAQRLGVVAQLAPGPDLEQLFQGAEPAGRGDEGVGQLGHARLARVHAVYHFQAGQALVADLGLLQALRDDPDHFAAGVCGVRHGAHQTDRAATVDQGQAALGQVPAEGHGGFLVDRGSAGAGATEYADGTQGHDRLLSGWKKAHRVAAGSASTKPCEALPDVASQARSGTSVLKQEFPVVNAGQIPLDAPPRPVRV